MRPEGRPLAYAALAVVRVPAETHGWLATFRQRASAISLLSAWVHTTTGSRIASSGLTVRGCIRPLFERAVSTSSITAGGVEVRHAGGLENVAAFS